MVIGDEHNNYIDLLYVAWMTNIFVNGNSNQVVIVYIRTEIVSLINSL